MIHKQKSTLCLSFFGITISSALFPLSLNRDNGIINNLPDEPPAGTPDPARAAREDC